MTGRFGPITLLHLQTELPSSGLHQCVADGLIASAVWDKTQAILSKTDSAVIDHDL